MLRGQAHFHVLAVRSQMLPPVPAGFTPLRIGGFGLVVAGWVDYQGGSILRYGELLAAVVGRWAGGISATVTHMWVDSPASRAGGRELWGYPKELASFDLAIDPSGTARARDPDGAELACGTFVGAGHVAVAHIGPRRDGAAAERAPGTRPLDLPLAPGIGPRVDLGAARQPAGVRQRRPHAAQPGDAGFRVHVRRLIRLDVAWRRRLRDATVARRRPVT